MPADVHHRETVDAEPVVLAIVATEAVIWNAIAVVTAALLPGAVLGLPAMGTITLPSDLLLALLSGAALLCGPVVLLPSGSLLLLLPLLILLSPGLLLLFVHSVVPLLLLLLPLLILLPPGLLLLFVCRVVALLLPLLILLPSGLLLTLFCRVILLLPPLLPLLILLSIGLRLVLS